ncbi:hypothetical protein [Gloeothece verrucosa]|uniref:Uncharacterized protein n=1 Tax=Gloeothece verrucosa (strain PCC 7822) TaxID=497965 RepID=E0UGJ5_GLOV7|nr:hypothetical protein [Gloeothece verrucosa]ADN13204.1 hypothetical protein Cyan7822_1198 [Gloeothece verrucosa PCC 7822]
MQYTPNVSLVAFYGSKPPPFRNLIQQLQNYLVEELEEQFQPYVLEQIHGTMIGYEGVKTDKGILSQWFWEHRNEERYINLSASIDYIRHTQLLPLNIRLGGYHPNINYGSKNIDPSLFERSFQFINNFAVLRGWPFGEQQILSNLNQLRLEFQRFNLLHKYHPKADSLDNDFYIRLGVLKVKPSDEKIKLIENRIRNCLKASCLVDILVDLENLSFVGYQDTSLPVTTTKVIPLKAATVAQIELLYA